MSQTPKTEPDAATPATTTPAPQTQTPTTSYAPTAWASSRMYQAPSLVVIIRDLTSKSYQKSLSTLSYSNNLHMPRMSDIFVLTSTHSVLRTQYYTQFQHSHYPQASYGHYQPYIPPAQTQTPGPVTAAVQRQSAQATNQVDTTDVATLNDAIGSAGVDLRVRALPSDQRPHTHTSGTLGGRGNVAAWCRSIPNISPI